MPSTYSDLKVELIATGEQSGTWGTTTNTNLSTALGEAITGSADVTFASANATITLTDTNGAQAARNLRLNLTGTSSGTHYLILGSGCNIEKLYLVNNTLGNSIIVQNTGGGTGVTVPAGKSMYVYNTGTNVVDAVTHLTSLTLGTDLAVADGGTGSSTLTAENVILGNGTNAVKFVAPGTTGNVLTSNGTTWTSAAAPDTGVTTFSAGTTGLTPNSASNGAITLGGTLAVGSGGTGATDAGTARTNLSAAASGANSDITSLSGLTTALSVGQGGTGANSITANAVVIGNGTSVVQTVAAGTSGNVLTSNGTNWISQAISAGGNYVQQTYTTAGPTTWTKPAGLKAIRVTVVGGGGGQGGAGGNPAQTPTVYNRGPGSGGGLAIEYIPAPSIPGPQTVTVGAGGAGTSANSSNPGGTSSFGAFCSATGGGGGIPGAAVALGAAAGLGSGGDINAYGGFGIRYTPADVGGPSFINQGRNAAGTLGAGGGGANTGTPRTGTAGGDGVVIVEEFY